MEISDSFDSRVLLVSREKNTADKINMTFMKAGLPEMDLETSHTNVLPKLKGQGYDWCVLDASALPDPIGFITKLKQSALGVRLPLVIIEDKERNFEKGRFYELGVNYVIDVPIDVYKANEACWIVTSLIAMRDLYKNVERLFR